jgi:hypothetical protein
MPLKCGITDYVNLLGKELKEKGHTVQIKTIDSTKDFTPVSHNLPDSDLYSLQFAPYAFSPNGLSRKKLIPLANLLTHKLTHVNFHEIWIGAYPNVKWKEKTIGWLQKREINDFINICNPASITCSNSAALDRMCKAGIDSNYLYLFGNIPYSPNKKYKSSKILKVATFGTLYEKFPYDQLAKTLAYISHLLKKPIHIRLLGRQRDKEGVRIMHEISQKYEFAISQSGELSSLKISDEFQNSDMGISTTPYDILGKSGATAAMLEHGLPILAYDDGDTPKNKLFVMDEFKDQVFLLTQDSTTEQIISFMQKPRKSFFDGVAYTANKMLEVFR